MNKATFAAAASSTIMNQKPNAPSVPSATTTITSQIAVVHLSSNGKSAAAPNSGGLSYNGQASAASKVVVGGRNGPVGPGVPPKPSMINGSGYRNGLTSDPVKSVKVNQSKLQQQQQQQSDHSDKSLTDDSTGSSPVPPDARAKQVLKEAVNAVVNSFAKHSQGGGYGRGKCNSC